MYDQLCSGYVLNWSEGDPNGCSTSRPGERECECIPLGISGMRELPNEDGTDMESGGNCEWKPSAAMGYLDGGRAEDCTEETDPSEGSRKDGTWVEGESALCVGLVAVWELEAGDWGISEPLWLSC